MVLVPKFLPWRPLLVLTGSSEYTVNTATGQITDHRDTWDALADNSYFSVSLSTFGTGKTVAETSGFKLQFATPLGRVLRCPHAEDATKVDSHWVRVVPLTLHPSRTAAGGPRTGAAVTDDRAADAQPGDTTTEMKS